MNIIFLIELKCLPSRFNQLFKFSGGERNILMEKLPCDKKNNGFMQKEEKGIII